MKILRIDSVCELTGLSRSSVYKQMREGDFPKSIHITKGAKGWSEAAVVEWVITRINNADTPSTSNRVSHLGELL